MEHQHDRLLRLTQRLDGFVAVTPADATQGAGSFVTKPFTFAGDHLELNLDAKGGAIRVELQDASGKPLPGFALADCTPISTNNVAATVAWKSHPSLKKVAGQTVRLYVEVNAAKLYAFQFR